MAETQDAISTISGAWDPVRNSWSDGHCIALDTSTTQVEEDAFAWASCGGTASRKKSKAYSAALYAAYDELDGACDDKYSYNSTSKIIYDYICTQKCAQADRTKKRGSGLGWCSPQSIRLMSYSSISGGCGGVFPTKRWGARVKAKGLCGCICNK